MLSGLVGCVFLLQWGDIVNLRSAVCILVKLPPPVPSQLSAPPPSGVPPFPSSLFLIIHPVADSPLLKMALLEAASRHQRTESLLGECRIPLAVLPSFTPRHHLPSIMYH